MVRGIIAYNPIAGRYPSLLLAERAASILRECDWEITLEQSHSGEHVTELARQAAATGLDAIFIAGGDGSLNCAIEGLVGTGTALGVLPSGTANVWAQELGLPGLSWTRWMALEESARMLASADYRQVDVGLCNQRPFLLWAGVGLDGFVVHRMEPRSRWEKNFAFVNYAASVVWHASSWRGINLRVVADGKYIEGHCLLALISNVHLYAGGLANLSPDARLDDGMMDLWLFEGDTMGDTVQVAWDLLSGRHSQSERVHHLVFSELTLESESKTYVQVDGDPLDVSEQVSISVLPKALRVLVPQETPHTLFSMG